MAVNEYFHRTPTSTGNIHSWTLSFWVKRNAVAANQNPENTSGAFFNFYTTQSSSPYQSVANFNGDGTIQLGRNQGGADHELNTTNVFRDVGSWMHILAKWDVTKSVAQERLKLYVNGTLQDSLTGSYPSLNYDGAVNTQVMHTIGTVIASGVPYAPSGPSQEYFDYFLVDGQALDADVFGFYKDGDGYISAGSTQSTDFRPGQWVPKKPSVIKNSINNSGGFGVNGFYLPMNDSSNFGADFHCAPNSIIKLKGEDLPQPRNGAPTTTDAYVSQLRVDPYAANLVLAVPGISTATGANLVTNGSFDNGTTGWTINDVTEGSMAVVGGQLVVSNTDTSDPPVYAYQLVTVEVGKRYTVGVDLVGGTASSIAYYLSYSNNPLASFASRPSNSGYGNRYISFTATSTTLYVILRVNANEIATAIFDNVVVKQEDAPRDYSADIKGSGTNKTLTAVGDAGVGYELGGYYGSAMTFDGTGDYLTSPANDPDFQPGSDDYTVEAWINPTSLTDGGGIAGIFNYDGVDRRSWLLYHGSSGDLNFIVSGDGTAATQHVVSSPVSILTTNQWSHVVGEKEGNDLRVYLNGVVVGTLTNAPTTLYTNTTDTFKIGTWDGTSNDEFTGDIQDVRVYKGVAKYKGGFDVPKPYTPVGIESWRAVSDCTANNFATLNPLANAVAGTLTRGNLQVSGTTAKDKHEFSTFGFTSGKWYVEVRDVDQQARGNILVSDADHDAATVGTNNVSVQMWDGTVATSGTDNGNLSAFSTGDILAIAYDADIGSVWIAKNEAVDTSGTAMATGISTTPERDYRFSYRESGGTQTTVNWNFGQNPTFSGQVSAASTQRNADSNGKGEFRYAPPSGFLALCEDNLPAPAVADPGDYFKTVLYTGDGNSGRSITGVGFQPDFVWIKDRNTSVNHVLTDSVRGFNNVLKSNANTGDTSATDTVLANSLDGFVLGDSAGSFSVNISDRNYVAWCWKVGAGTTSVNTDGTIDSVVSVNQDAGFSIVTYTSTGSNTATETVGHGLNKTPNMIILKNRSAAVNWRVYHSGINDAGKNSVTLNSTEATYVFWPSVGSDTFGLANSTTTGQAAGSGGEDIVAYCWSEIEGFSKFGSYVGNGSADGPFIYTGGKPAFVMIKRTDTTGEWFIFDSSRNSSNSVSNFLQPNSSNIEVDGGAGLYLDFLSNGFKWRSNAGALNASGGTYIFACWMESPFTTANAK
jgi:hypothetical protein